MEKGKGTTLFRILVIVLLAANLAVNTLVYVRLGRSGHDISKETGTVSEETVKAEDSAEKAAVPETPEAPERASDTPVYDYTWAYSRSDRVEISKLWTEEDVQAGEPCWIFRITLPGAEEDMVLTEIQINNLIDGKITAEYSAPEWLDHLDDLNGLPLGETTVLPAGWSLYWEDAHPYTEEFNGREYRFIFTASGGEVSYSYIYELDGSPASRTAAQTPADYSTDNGRDLAALRCDAGFEIEVFEGVYWVSASALGKTRFTNAQVYRLLSDTPEEKQARSSAIEQGLKACTQPPLAVMQLCAEGLELLESLLGKTNATAASDFGVACLSLRAGMQGAWLNVCINTGSLHDAAFAAGARAAGQKLLDTGLPRADRCYAAMLAACREK